MWLLFLHTGVYARKSIVARTQYGPFIAEVETDKQEAMKRSEEEKSLLLQVLHIDGHKSKLAICIFWKFI